MRLDFSRRIRHRDWIATCFVEALTTPAAERDPRQWFSGPGVPHRGGLAACKFYGELLKTSRHLASESPFGEKFRYEGEETRGVALSNNRRNVRLADDAVARFGEGGTGMSRMATNAQNIFDRQSLPGLTPAELRMREELYARTILGNRKLISGRLKSGKADLPSAD